MAGIRTFQHEQILEAREWVIRHGLGTFPIVDTHVFINGVLTKIIADDIILEDENTVRVLFTQPYRGSARLV